MITIKKGLDIPLAGSVNQVIHNDLTVNEVAITGSSFNNFKPTLKVKEGEKVIKGQLLMIDKKRPAVAFTAPCSGIVKAIHRGERRVFQSLVISVDHSDNQEVEFKSFKDLASLKGKKEELKQELLDAGLWAFLRTRPFNNTADYTKTPESLFINAHDTNPGCANPNVIIKEDLEFFNFGLEVLAEIFDEVEKKFVVGNAEFNFDKVNGFKYEQFNGPHPAGLVGTHINYLAPVTLEKQAWHISYQEVIQIGKLIKNGKLDLTKVVSLSGPMVLNPTLYRVPYGASIDDLVLNRIKTTHNPNRLISGSCLDGVTAKGPFAYIGFYDNLVTVLEEGYDQFLFGWILPQPKKFSLTRANFSKRKDVNFTTSTNGSERGMVPIGLYERVFPLIDIYPTLLLRDIISNDTDSAQELGILELAEEDLSLCSFVCQGKYDYALLLRKALNKIEREG